MTAAIAISRATIRQFLGLRRSIILIVLEIALGAIYLVSAGALATDAALDWLLGMAMTVFFPVLVPIVALVVSASALGAERRDATLSFIVLRPIPRFMIATSKLVAAILIAGVLNALGGAALGGAYGIVSGSWNLVAPFAVGAFLASAVYAAVFVPIGLLTDRAVLVGLAFVFIFRAGRSRRPFTVAGRYRGVRRHGAVRGPPRDHRRSARQPHARSRRSSRQGRRCLPDLGAGDDDAATAEGPRLRQHAPAQGSSPFTVGPT
jgi:ABC-2 type transport system permease protein